MHKAYPAGGRKRKFVEDDDDEGCYRPHKRAKTSKNKRPRPPLRDRDILDAESFFRTNHGGGGPHYIGRSAMMAVKEHIVKLSNREQAMMSEVDGLRRDFIKMLESSMSLRRKVVQGLGQPSVDGEMREKAKLLLTKHRVHMAHNEEQLIKLEGVIPGHGMANQLASRACKEIDEKLALWETSIEDPNLSLDDFPRILDLVRLTGNGATISKLKTENGDVTEQAHTCTCQGTGTVATSSSSSNSGIQKPSFTLFQQLPTELRLQVWEVSLGEPRNITHSSIHNKTLSLLATCRESRSVARGTYVGVISPSKNAVLGRTLFSYINLDIDIVVRDLISREPIPRDISSVTNPSLFDLEDNEFNTALQSALCGLSKVKHLALGFDIFKHNGGRLFPNLQACCPILETLRIFPNSQLESDLRRPPNDRGYKFIDFDSNFTDLISLNRDRLRRSDKQTAAPAMDALQALSNYTIQYRNAFPKYVAHFSQDNWRPTIQVCMLATWNDNYEGWQTGCLDLDYYPQGFYGSYMDHYYGFIESCVVCNADGELISRYDGIEQLFKEE